MGMKDKLKEIILGTPDEVRERARKFATDEANRDFNVYRIDGVDYVTYKGNIISVKTDKDILDRLATFREAYIKNHSEC